MMINISEQFSETPAGRFKTDGDFSGQRFRDELLIPALDSGQIVTVELAGTRGYGSSFLEEAFGGLVRLGLYTADQLAERLKIIASKPSYEVYRNKALQYIAKAKFGVDRGRMTV